VALAADGVDEILTFIERTDAPRAWTLEFGRFSGTSPTSDRSHDFDTARLSSERTGAGATVRGSAWELDHWLWGRTGDDSVRRSGDAVLLDRLRAVAAENTL
jgi:hypothetical protein